MFSLGGYPRSLNKDYNNCWLYGSNILGNSINVSKQIQKDAYYADRYIDELITNHSYSNYNDAIMWSYATSFRKDFHLICQ